MLFFDSLRYIQLTDPTKQTLPSGVKKAPKQSKEAKSYGSIPIASAASPLSGWQLLAIPSLRSLIISAFALSFVSTAFETVFVLFAYTPIEVGGLAFNVSVESRTFPGVFPLIRNQF